MTKRGPCLVCECGAYAYPHRLTGGKCDGSEWAGSYYLHIREECEYCQLNNMNICEVATGQESVRHCAAYQTFIHSGDDTRLPIDESTFQEQYENYQYSQG